MEKLLIIGAGIGQMPLLMKAKKRGIHVTVATKHGDYPCIDVADDVIYKDIYDRDGIVDEARKRCITAVISDQNDLMNPTVAYVAEKMGLPGNKFDTVMSYCNKNVFRNICDKALIPVPAHIAVDSDKVDFSGFKCSFPLIVKPADSQSSIGVKKVESREELAQAIDNALRKSPTHNAIVEEFFSGQEIVCEGMIENGTYHLLSFGDRKYFDLPELMIPSQTLFPSVMDDKLLKRIVDYETKLADIMKPSFAIVHSEYLVNIDSKEIRIVESALRGGGVYISSDLIPMATGIDINNWLLDKALGIDGNIDILFKNRINKAAGYVCFCLPEGIVYKVSGYNEVKSNPFVDKAYIDDIKVGQRIEPMTYKGARKGPILVRGDNRIKLEENIKKLQNTFEIIVKMDDGNLAGIIWGE